jgi:hypothetical protein
MALWQFDISLVPKAGPMPWRVAEGHEVPSLGAPLIRSAEGLLTQQFGSPWLLMEDWLVFGEENDHRVDLLRNEDGSGQLSARVSARLASTSFCATISQVAVVLDCVFFSAEFWRAVEPTPSALAQALSESRASQFVRNPLSVLRGSAA